ncbi:MAG: TRAP transporter small permease [Lachnospiraceae bacterium]|nr:TRAP transporter small permease [Lachnospiraceae bacterium]
MYKAYTNVTNLISKILGFITMIFLILMVIACFAQVCVRNMGLSVPWIEEVSRYSQVWITFLGGSLAYKHSSLAAVELLKNKLKGKAGAILDLFIWVLCVTFFVLMVRHGFALASKMAMQITPSLKISKAYVYGALPMGGCFMLLFSLEHLINDIRTLTGKEDKA